MGAENFEHFVNGADANKAFDEAVRQAEYSYGHAGYTGTMAEKDSFVIIQGEPLPVNAARDLANDLIRDHDDRIDDKWGPAGAIPVGDNSGITGWLFFGWASS